MFTLRGELGSLNIKIEQLYSEIGRHVSRKRYPIQPA